MGVYKGDDFMYETVCIEPKVGPVTHRVYNVVFTPDNLSLMWEKARKFRTLMGIEIPTYEHFLNFFVNIKDDKFEAKGLLCKVDDFVGAFWMTDINYQTPPFSASVHYTFFDGRQRGRALLCREGLKYIFETYDFARLWTQAPLFSPATIKFVEDIGFRKQSRIKNHQLYKGKLFDTNVYSITPKELEKYGTRTDTKPITE